MRHEKRSKRLGRKSSHRKATLKNMARALLVKESIRTTKTKAKVAQSYIDKLITTAKSNTPESKRQVFALIRDKGLINLLFNEVAPRFKTRNGGYTRVIPLYPRRGDGSPMAILELVERKPKVEPKKAKKLGKQAAEEGAKKEEKPKKAEPEKTRPTKESPPQAEKEEHKVAPEPKADVKEEIRKEKAREEEKKIKKGSIFKNIRRYFRGKAP
ncbi:50S ribosomal protein L17 [Omnitrophica bacterium]|nr:50S ribosomal protein L17 [Candidatus Omnitrophota bacterium]